MNIIIDMISKGSNNVAHVEHILRQLAKHESDLHDDHRANKLPSSRIEFLEHLGS